MFYSSEAAVRLVLMRGEDYIIRKVEKNEYDDLGLEFESFLMDKKKSCSNKCVFCFIDQMPPGMRETLYFKDDDARLSFLQVNYVTLTNLNDHDIERIIKMRLDINVSVHTTNPELRCMMMKNRFAGEKLKYLRMLSDSGLFMNCQIVLCPGLNDGEELRRTITDLSKLNISSIAVVPVGITKFREGLYPLTLFDKEGAARNIDIIESFHEDFMERFGSRLIYPADELFICAGRDIPPNEYYEDYPQYENGVGMLRSLEYELTEALGKIPAGRHFPDRKVSIATGMLAGDFIRKLTDRITARFDNIECSVYKIRNDFFGETITVTGLLTARDIIAQLKGRPLGDELLISSSMIRAEGRVFLDDLTVGDVEKSLGIRIRPVDNDGTALLKSIIGVE